MKSKRYVYGNRALAAGTWEVDYRTFTRFIRVFDSNEWGGFEEIGRQYMMEVKITLRIEFDREGKAEREKLMLDLSKTTAKELLAQAAMLQGKRAPSIALECGDFFADEAAIKIFDDTTEQ